jgi:hypothetical protein
MLSRSPFLDHGSGRYPDYKYRMTQVLDLTQSAPFDTSRWHTICDLTLTLKQGRQADNGTWVRLDEGQCRKAFRFFMKLLNREIYGNAVSRHGKRLKVLPVLEREVGSRWHYHAAIEPPSHLDGVRFKQLVRQCWSKVDWAYDRILLRDNADSGWIDYILKPRQKSGLEAWSDCIDWESLHNPIADA